MWRTKLRNFFSISNATKKHIKVGAATVFLAGILHSTASFHVMLSIMIFVVFSMYLYLERINQKLNDLRDNFEATSKVRIGLVKAKPQGTTEKGAQQATVKPEDIIPVTEEIKHEVEELVQKYEEFPKIENKLNELQESFDHLGDINTQRAEIDRLRESVKKSVNIIQEFHRRLNFVLEQTSHFKEVFYRLTKVEDKTELLNNMISLFDRTNKRLTFDEDRVNTLAESVNSLGISLNHRIDDLASTLQNSFKGITSNLARAHE